MKKIVFCLVTILISTGFLHAQKVKFKKGICSVNKVAFLKYECRHVHIEPCLFTSLSEEKKVLVVKSYPYRRPVPGRPNEMQNSSYYEIEFWDTEYIMFSTDNLLVFFRKLYNSGAVSSDGLIDQNKLKDFVKINGERQPEVISTF